MQKSTAKNTQRKAFFQVKYSCGISDIYANTGTCPDRKSGIYKICPKTFFFGSGKEHSFGRSVIKVPDNISAKAAFSLSAVAAGTGNTPLRTVALTAAAQQTRKRISGAQQSRRILFLFLPQMFRNTGRRNRCSREQRSENSRNQHTQCRP